MRVAGWVKAIVRQAIVFHTLPFSAELRIITSILLWEAALKDKEYILKAAKDQNVKFIRLWFTDILGMLKSFSITIAELEDALKTAWASMVHL